MGSQIRTSSSTPSSYEIIEALGSVIICPIGASLFFSRSAHIKSLLTPSLFVLSTMAYIEGERALCIINRPTRPKERPPKK